MKADRRRVLQVLGNLLSNAAKHSPESSAIRVAAQREGLHAAFSVAADGRGISADLLSHLFSKFSRGTERTKAARLAGLAWDLPSARG